MDTDRRRYRGGVSALKQRANKLTESRGKGLETLVAYDFTALKELGPQELYSRAEA